MSLLTGEPRSARVSALTECQVIEVQRAGLDSILQERPEIIEQLADIMAERRLKNELMMTAHQQIASSDLLRAYVGEIRARIASFFRIAPLMPIPSVSGGRASLDEAAPPDYRET
jgi:CRP-like cAMP-binding protein